MEKLQYGAIKMLSAVAKAIAKKKQKKQKILLYFLASRTSLLKAIHTHPCRREVHKVIQMLLVLLFGLRKQACTSLYA